MSIGKRLKIVRGNMTQHKFAELLSAHSNTVARYEREERSPDTEYIKSVAEVTGVNIQWLTTGEGPMKKGDRMVSTLARLTLIIDILEDYNNELGEKFTHKKKSEIIDKLYESLFNDGPVLEKTKKDIHDTIMDIYNLLPTLDRMLETEKDRDLAKKIIKNRFEKVLPDEEAEREANELIDSRLLGRTIK